MSARTTATRTVLGGQPLWAVAVPSAAVVVLAITWGGEPGALLAPVAVMLVAVMQVAAVTAAVHQRRWSRTGSASRWARWCSPSR